MAARSQISIFALSAAIAGIGGALMGITYSSFTNLTATSLTGLLSLAAAVTFGIRDLEGADSRIECGGNHTVVPDHLRMELGAT